MVARAGDREGRPYGVQKGVRRGGGSAPPAGGVEPRPYGQIDSAVGRDDVGIVPYERLKVN